MNQKPEQFSTVFHQIAHDSIIFTTEKKFVADLCCRRVSWDVHVDAVGHPDDSNHEQNSDESNRVLENGLTWETFWLASNQ